MSNTRRSREQAQKSSRPTNLVVKDKHKKSRSGEAMAERLAERGGFHTPKNTYVRKGKYGGWNE